MRSLAWLRLKSMYGTWQNDHLFAPGRVGGAASLTSVASSERDFTPSNLQMDVVHMSYPSKVDSDNESTQDQLRDVAIMDRQHADCGSMGDLQPQGATFC